MGDGWVTQLRKGVLEYCVLLALKGRASYGYEIVQALRRSEDLDVGESTVYPILARLREEGCLARRRVPSPSGPPRTYFSLTLEGKMRLAAMDEAWGALERILESLRGRAGEQRTGEGPRAPRGDGGAGEGEAGTPPCRPEGDIPPPGGGLVRGGTGGE